MLLQDTLSQHALLWDALLKDALLRDALLWDALLRDAVVRNFGCRMHPSQVYRIDILACSVAAGGGMALVDYLEYAAVMKSMKSDDDN